LTASESALTAPVLVECPACGELNPANAEKVGNPIVCRECGETWPHAPPAAKRSKTKGRKAQSRSKPRRGMLIEAERRPLVTYSDGSEQAWAAKIAGDYWPEPERRSRLPSMLAATAAVAFLAAFFAGREAAVAALPDLAGLYAAIGLPVNLQRLSIEDVGAERRPTFGGERVTVRATIRNLSSTPQELPELATILYDEGRGPAGIYGFDPPAGTIGAGASMPILIDVEGAIGHAATIALRFRRPGESLPAAGEARAID
jgi:hypothetical protein